MNEARVLRLIRELRCDPVTRWFEAMLGVTGSSPAQSAAPAPRIVEYPAPLDSDDEVQARPM